MDDTIRVFSEYFRDIYSASSSNCAGKCDSVTPPTSGPNGYDLRRCCKAACADQRIASVKQCKAEFCPEICATEMIDKSALSECVRICSEACGIRFKTD
jgi:hypothetical protein